MKNNTTRRTKRALLEFSKVSSSFRSVCKSPLAALAHVKTEVQEPLEASELATKIIKMDIELKSVEKISRTRVGWYQ